MTETTPNFANYISPVFDGVLADMMDFRHDQYFLGGGRGSFKSTTVSVRVFMAILSDPNANAVVFRKVKDTIAGTVFARYLKTATDLGLLKYFRFKTSPHGIFFTNKQGKTQEIRFLGLDKVDKSKSIEFAHGYCQVAHFEELDQFEGWQEVHTVLESLGRGGEHFQMIGTYNPPESLASWVNTEARIKQPNRLVHISNYTMHPRYLAERWLGLPFLREAEAMRVAQPERYRHIYLGEATGTGGEVFKNVEVRTITQEERDGFRRVRWGMDFGQADPTTLVGTNYDANARTLYIFSSWGMSDAYNADVLKALKERDLLSTPIIGDEGGGGKGVMKELRSMGARYLRDAYKPKGSVERGVRWLRELIKIVIDPETAKGAAREFTQYEWERMRDGTYRNEYPDRDNHYIDAARYANETDIFSGAGSRLLIE